MDSHTKKKCSLCFKLISKSNYSKHARICTPKHKNNNNNIENTTNEEEKKLKEELFEKNSEISKLKHALSVISSAVTVFEQNQQSSLANLDFNDWGLAPASIKKYFSVWKLYSTFVNSNSKHFGKVSADLYLQNVPIGSRRTVRAILQSIFASYLPGTRLKRVKKAHFKKKNYMSEQAMDDWLKQEIKNEDYIFYYFIRCLIRPHALAGLQVKHIRFDENFMYVPDTKVGMYSFKFDEFHATILKKFCLGKESEDFVFSIGYSPNLNTRANTLVKRLSRNMKRSLGERASAYLLRRSEATEKFKRNLDVALAETAKQTGHAGTQVVANYYIDKNLFHNK